MHVFTRLACSTTILTAMTLALSAQAQAGLHSSSTKTSARVSLWDDVNADGILGSTGDVLRSRTTTTEGTFALAAAGCGACGVVIDQVQGSENVAAPRVSMSLDGKAMKTMGGLLWRDADGNGVLENGSDSLIGTATTGDGVLTLPAPLCGTCGLIVVDWVGSGQDIDWVGSGQDIDTISGTILDWGGSSQDIDWGGSSDDIDWGGSGDDIDWGGSGDDIDWGGSGDDIDASSAHDR